MLTLGRDAIMKPVTDKEAQRYQVPGPRSHSLELTKSGVKSKFVPQIHSLHCIRQLQPVKGGRRHSGWGVQHQQRPGLRTGPGVLS